MHQRKKSLFEVKVFLKISNVRYSYLISWRVQICHSHKQQIVLQSVQAAWNE